jgi:tRNA-dihydrouridine synthase A
MIDVTDRHCRFFHRLLAPRARLYSEMITTGALLHGNVPRHLDFDPAEHPIALQLGGCDPMALAQCARLGQQWGYDEINLNCGCPSSRVQRGAFGACLMAEPGLVADCIKAMQDAVSIPVTVKHRLGLDYDESYGPVRDFVGVVHAAGCRVFIVHARNAVLKGLSPKENREIPPLKYDVAYRLKRDFPDLEILINGGVKTNEEIALHLQHVDGVMLGREAYHNPYLMATWDERFYGDTAPARSRAEVLAAMVSYTADQLARHGAHGMRLNSVTRHMLGIMAGLPGARAFRQLLSDPKKLASGDPALLLEAAALVDAYA